MNFEDMPATVALEKVTGMHVYDRQPWLGGKLAFAAFSGSL